MTDLTFGKNQKGNFLTGFLIGQIIRKYFWLIIIICIALPYYNQYRAAQQGLTKEEFIARKLAQTGSKTANSANKSNSSKKANTNKAAEKEAERRAARQAEENMRKFNEQLKANQQKGKQANNAPNKGKQKQQQNQKGKPINVTPPKKD